MPLDINGQGSISGITSLNTVVSDAELERLDGVTGAIQTQLNGKLPIAGGKILQIVRATDTTSRTTTSTSLTDASMSVTITPQFNTSAILLLLAVNGRVSNSTNDDLRGIVAITDASNNVIAGAEAHNLGTLNVTGTSARDVYFSPLISAYATPTTTNATTYKVRFRVTTANSTIQFFNNTITGTFYALEVSA